MRFASTTSIACVLSGRRRGRLGSSSPTTTELDPGESPARGSRSATFALPRNSTMPNMTPKSAKPIPRPGIESMLEPPVHPGEVLREDFLDPLGLTQTAFAARLDISLQRLNDLLCGRRGVTPDTALRLARVLGTSPQFWINLHDAWALWHATHGPASDQIALLEPLRRDRQGRLVAT